jgi:hypothetical protein
MKSIRSVLFGMVWLLLLAVPTATAAAEKEAFFYSVHVASFQTIENVRKSVLSLSKDGIVVFWKRVETPGETAPFRIYFGRYPNEREAVSSWKRLHKAGLVEHFGIHLLRESRVASVSSPKPNTGLSDRKPLTPESIRKAWEGERFVDNGDGTVTDRLNQLMWAKSGWRAEFVSAANWWDAEERVKSLRLNGHDDWRLPTIGEWVSLVDRSQQAPAIVEPNPFENIITHLPYWSQTEYTYGIDYTCKNVCPFEAYTVLMYSGSVLHQNKADLAFIMPIRSLTSDEEDRIATRETDTD